MKRVHTITVDGQTYKRTSASRQYSHVVVGRRTPDENREALQWSLTQENAQRAAREWYNRGWHDVAIKPVEISEKSRSTKN